MGLFDGTSLERPVLCDRCGQDIKVCRCPPVDTEPGKQTLRIRLEKRKGGKIVTVIQGFSCSESQMQATLSQLRSKCGAGGALADQSIELQGDHTARLPQLLTLMGYRVK